MPQERGQALPSPTPAPPQCSACFRAHESAHVKAMFAHSSACLPTQLIWTSGLADWCTWENGQGNTEAWMANWVWFSPFNFFLIIYFIF